MNNYDNLHKAFKNLIEITKTIKSSDFDDNTKGEILSKIDDSLVKLEYSYSKIEQTSQFYKLVFDSTNDVIITFNKNGLLLNANKAFFNMLGIAEWELIEKKSLLDFIKFTIDFKNIEDCIKFIESHLKKEIELDIIKKDTSTIPCTLYFNKAEVLGELFYVCVIKDNSRNLEIQNKINSYYNELEYLNRELELSEKALKELNASKDRFFSIISHDLKSPFTALLALIDMLENEGNDLNEDEFKELSTSIAKSVRKVFKLLENLLSWARVQTGAMKFTESEFDLVQICKESLELYEEAAKDKSINLVFETDMNSLSIKADKNMIQTVIRNLISNAVKFTREEGTVKVKLEEDPSFVNVFVVDNGLGMDKNILDNLFKIDKYNSRLGTNKEKGTGLGLILCKELIEMNGGTIDVKSEPEKGSTFHIQIPKK